MKSSFIRGHLSKDHNAFMRNAIAQSTERNQALTPPYKAL